MDYQKIILQHSNEFGKYQQKLFLSCSKNNCEYEIKSPIERVLYSSLRLVSLTEFGHEQSDQIYLSNGECVIRGIGISPQFKVGKYKVDFLVYLGCPIWCKQKYSEVLVECDSQEFHERTEEERRYEKQRDRFFISRGYKVLHFTGKEILYNFKLVATEIINFLEKTLCENNG